MKWRRRAAALGGLLAFVAFAIGGLRVYRNYRTEHLAKQAEQFAAAGDFKSGVLVARRLLALDPKNLIACRAMAEMAEKSARPDAIEWRKKIAQLEPSPGNQIAVARCALRFGQRDLAAAVLRALPEQARASAEYHQIAGAEALARRDNHAAESHFAAASASAPQDAQLALNLAAVRLISNDPVTAEDARQKLASLTSDSRVRLSALRALASDALARKNQVDARRWTAQLKNESEATYHDLLLRFEAVAGTEEAPPALADLQIKAAADPATTAELITWLNRHDLPQVAAYWAVALPKPIREMQPVPLAIGESYSFLQDWVALRKHVAGKNWGEFEALRLAVESHALRRLNASSEPSMEAQTAWASALQATQNRPEQLLAIAQLAEGWGYQDDAETAWWKLTQSNENSRTALSALQRIYKAKQDTHGLLRVAQRALELNPNDLVAANNVASLGLLLSGDSTARRLASKLHNEHPNNRVFAATYAFALDREGKTEEGLELMQTLQKDELRHPSIAAYYVVMLVNAGDFERAREYLPSAEHAPLLPEERELLMSAARKLHAS